MKFLRFTDETPRWVCVETGSRRTFHTLPVLSVQIQPNLFIKGIWKTEVSPKCCTKIRQKKKKRIKVESKTTLTPRNKGIKKNISIQTGANALKKDVLLNQKRLKDRKQRRRSNIQRRWIPKFGSHNRMSLFSSQWSAEGKGDNAGVRPIQFNSVRYTYITSSQQMLSRDTLKKNHFSSVTHTFLLILVVKQFSIFG